MPTIVTPPDLERHPRRAGEDDGGHGRRPPNDHDLKHTGGGGDNDDHQPERPRHPGQRLANYRFVLFFVLGAVFVFFTGMVGAFSFAHAVGHGKVWLPTAIPRLLWIDTVLMLLSSFTVERARRHIFHPIDAMEEWFGLGHPISRRALPWLLATLILGVLFLAGERLVWHQLALQEVSFRSSADSAHAFYILTCVHAAYLAAGVAGLIAALVGLVAFRSVENRQIAVDCIAWYWHAMTALWLCLFAQLALHA
jgi:cytochrome c oxidase subunit 3